MRLLLINANTTQAVTDGCVAAARRIAQPETEVSGATASFGAEIISNRAQNAVAGHALLDMIAEHEGKADCILIAVSYDTALLAAREASSVPVIGMTEAVLRAASMLGERVGMVCFSTPHLYRELARSYGLGERLAAVETIERDPRAAYSDPASTHDAVTQAIEKMVREDQIDVAVLCGAAMAGLSPKFAHLSVPVLDGISAGVTLGEALARQLRFAQSGV